MLSISPHIPFSPILASPDSVAAETEDSPAAKAGDLEKGIDHEETKEISTPEPCNSPISPEALPDAFYFWCNPTHSYLTMVPIQAASSWEKTLATRDCFTEETIRLTLEKLGNDLMSQETIVHFYGTLQHTILKTAVLSHFNAISPKILHQLLVQLLEWFISKELSCDKPNDQRLMLMNLYTIGLILLERNQSKGEFHCDILEKIYSYYKLINEEYRYDIDYGISAWINSLFNFKDSSEKREFIVVLCNDIIGPSAKLSLFGYPGSPMTQCNALYHIMMQMRYHGDIFDAAAYCEKWKELSLQYKGFGKSFHPSRGSPADLKAITTKMRTSEPEKVLEKAEAFIATYCTPNPSKKISNKHTYAYNIHKFIRVLIDYETDMDERLLFSLCEKILTSILQIQDHDIRANRLWELSFLLIHKTNIPVVRWMPVINAYALLENKTQQVICMDLARLFLMMGDEVKKSILLKYIGQKFHSVAVSTLYAKTLAMLGYKEMLSK